MISRSRRDSVGGGVVAEFVRGPESRRDSVGGGVVAEFFRHPQRRDSVGGGVVAAIFRDLHLREVNSYPTFTDRAYS